MDLYKKTFWTSFFDEMSKTAMSMKSTASIVKAVVPKASAVVKPPVFKTPSTKLVQLGKSNPLGGNNVISAAAGQLKGGASASSTHQVANALKPPGNVPAPTSHPMSAGSGATATPTSRI